MSKWLVLLSLLAAASAATHYQRVEALGDNGTFRRNPNILDDEKSNIGAEVFDSPNDSPSKRSVKSMDSDSDSDSDSSSDSFSSSFEEGSSFRKAEVSQTDSRILKRTKRDGGYSEPQLERRRREVGEYEPQVQKMDQWHGVPQLERKRREIGEYHFLPFNSSVPC